jgi:formate-dependent nitrite reductase membrane component NrfD
VAVGGFRGRRAARGDGAGVFRREALLKLRRPDATSEARLAELRRAGAAGAVDASGVRAEGGPLPAAAGADDVAAAGLRGSTGGAAPVSYYGRPVLKEPTWTWEVPLYFFVGGAAGAAAVIGAAARRSGGDEELARDARWIAAAGGALSAPLLISDLGRPERFLAMLRVMKLGSPMSVGAWTLAAFGSAAGAAAFAELVDRQSGGKVPVKVVGDAAELLAAATGLVMSTYTGVLVGATAIPVWNRNVGLLPIHFAASGLGAAVGLLELLGHRRKGLRRLGLAAAATETLTALAHEADGNAANRPLREGRSGALVRSASVLAGPLALVLRLAGARRAAAVSAVVGSLLTRYAWLEAGKASARDPHAVLGPPPGSRGEDD